MPNVVDIIFNGIDKTGTAGKSVLGNLNSLSKGVLGFGLDAAGAAVVLYKLIDYTKQVTEETQTYNLSMIDLAQKMQTTSDEASRIVQISDDLRISQDKVTLAMQYMAKNGLEPSIDGLANLADEYNALETPAEKMNLLMKTFGRSGADMGRLLEKGSDGIRKMSSNIQSGLIVTAAAAKASESYYRNTDTLNDSLTALNRTVGNQTIPLMSNVNFILAQSASGWASIFEELVPGMGAADVAEQAWNQQIKETVRLLLTARTVVEKFGLGAEGAEEALKRFESAQSSTNETVRNGGNAIAEASGQIDQLKPRVESAGQFIKDFGETFTELKTRVQDGSFIGDLSTEFSELKERGVSVNDQLDAMNNHNFTGMTSSIENALNLIDWKAAGGDKLEAGFQQIQVGEAIGAITEPQAKALYQALYIEQQALEVKLGDISKSAAQVNIAETLGIPIDEAAKRLDQAKKDAELGRNSVVEMIDDISSVKTEEAQNEFGNLESSIQKAVDKVKDVQNGLDAIPGTTEKKLRVTVQAVWDATGTIPPGIRADIMRIAQAAVADTDDPNDVNP